jgi:3-oxoacyl-[acyl-carrier-protein] synthase II
LRAAPNRSPNSSATAPADAHHVTSGPEDCDGARRAMEIAIAQAGISPRDVSHLNAHATSTPVGDLGEIEAIRSVFGRDFAIAVSATKSATGHLLGAAGGLGAIFTVLALRDQVGFGFGGVNASALFRRWTDKLADASAGGSHH